MRKIFLIRNFWANERPSSTESESSHYMDAVPGPSRELLIQQLESSLQNQELSNMDLRCLNRKLQNEIRVCQNNLLNQEKTVCELKTKNDALKAEMNDKYCTRNIFFVILFLVVISLGTTIGFLQIKGQSSIYLLQSEKDEQEQDYKSEIQKQKQEYESIIQNDKQYYTNLIKCERLNF